MNRARWMAIAVAAGLPVLAAVPALPLVTGKPSMWQRGFRLLELETFDAAASSLNLTASGPNTSALNGSTSFYPPTSSTGWPIGTFGYFHAPKVAAGATPEFTLGWYNQIWAKPTNSTVGAIRLKTDDKTKPVHIDYAVDPTFATHLYLPVMGVNVFADGGELGSMEIDRKNLQTGAIEKSKIPFNIGANLRSFAQVAGMNYAVSNSTNTAKQLWSGPCSNNKDLCFIDYIDQGFSPALAAKPIVGVRFYGNAVSHYEADTNVKIWASLRLHGLTLASNFEAQNNGQAPVEIGQCGCGGIGADKDESYGGTVVNGQLWGSKRNICALGCGLTSATMTVNYYGAPGSPWTPFSLNKALRENNGFGHGQDGTTEAFTAGWQSICASLSNGATALPIDACACCTTDACKAANCPAPDHQPPAAGDLAPLVQTCCAIAGLPATQLPAGTGAAIDDRVELRPCSKSGGVCVANSDTDDFKPQNAKCGGAALPARPVVFGAGDSKVAMIEVLAQNHPFNLTGCVPLGVAGYGDRLVHPTSHLPCLPGLLLAKVVATQGGAIGGGLTVGYFQNVNFQRIPTVIGATTLRFDSAMSLSSAADAKAKALQVEQYLGQSMPVILRVKNDRHFLLATGIKPVWYPDAVNDAAIAVPAGGGFVGTWLVRDPGNSAGTTLADTLKASEARNQFSGYRILHPQTPTASMAIRVYSPAQLLVTAADGKQLGYKGGSIVEDIVGSDYGEVAQDVPPDSEADPQHAYTEAWLPDAPTGTAWQVQLAGTGNGPYRLEVLWQPVSGPALAYTQTGIAKLGAVQALQLQLPLTPDGKLAVADLPVTDADADGAAVPADCNDADKAVSPLAAENCSNSQDDDCDGLADADDPQCAPGAPACADSDGDGYAVCDGNCTAGGKNCGDCDDGKPSVHPGAAEAKSAPSTCSDGIDNDCDGVVDAASNACGQPAPASGGSGDGGASADVAGDAGSSAELAGDAGADAPDGPAVAGLEVVAEAGAEVAGAPDSQAPLAGGDNGSVAATGAGKAAGSAAASSGCAARAVHPLGGFWLALGCLLLAALPRRRHKLAKQLGATAPGNGCDVGAYEQ